MGVGSNNDRGNWQRLTSVSILLSHMGAPIFHPHQLAVYLLQLLTTLSWKDDSNIHSITRHYLLYLHPESIVWLNIILRPPCSSTRHESFHGDAPCLVSFSWSVSLAPPSKWKSPFIKMLIRRPMGKRRMEVRIFVLQPWRLPTFRICCRMEMCG